MHCAYPCLDSRVRFLSFCPGFDSLLSCPKYRWRVTYLSLLSWFSRYFSSTTIPRTSSVLILQSEYCLLPFVLLFFKTSPMRRSTAKNRWNDSLVYCWTIYWTIFPTLPQVVWAVIFWLALPRTQLFITCYALNRDLSVEERHWE